MGLDFIVMTTFGTLCESRETSQVGGDAHTPPAIAGRCSTYLATYDLVTEVRHNGSQSVFFPCLASTPMAPIHGALTLRDRPSVLPSPCVHIRVPSASLDGERLAGIHALSARRLSESPHTAWQVGLRLHDQSLSVVAVPAE